MNIGDAFSGDNDKVTVMAGALQKNNLKLTSIENLEIVNSNVQTPVILNGTNFKGLEAVKLIGDATILNVSDFTQGVTIDATANADSITGSDKADTINGGAGNDTIVGNDGDDVLTGGNGADEFVVGTVKAAGVDQILDFSAEDKISIDSLSILQNFSAQRLKKFDASTFSTVTYKTLDSVLATFGSGGANVTNPGDVVIFSYDGKTYALLANGPFTETGSALVDITGANVASLTESNFGGATNPTPPEPIIPAPPVEPYPDYAAFVNAVAFGTIPAGKLAEISTLTGQEAGLLAVNKTYLDKIAADGIKSVTSDIVVTVGTGADNLSNNFNSAEFETKLADGALGSNVMNITGSTKDDVIVTSFGGTINGGDGNDTITVSAAAGAVSIDGGSGADTITVSAAAGAVNINGGSGNNTITANAAATITGGNDVDTIYLKAGGSVDGGAGADKIYVSGSGAATIKGGDDADTIDASAATGAVTIEGGAGNDTISLGSGADVVKFTSKGDTNADTIKNFTTGAGGDKLDFTTLLTTVTAAKSATSLGLDGSGLSIANLEVDSGSQNVLFIKDQATLTTSNFSTSAASATAIKIKDNTSYVVIAKDTSVDNIYYVKATSGTVAVDKVGTVESSGAITEFDVANFA